MLQIFYIGYACIDNNTKCLSRNCLYKQKLAFKEFYWKKLTELTNTWLRRSQRRVGRSTAKWSVGYAASFPSWYFEQPSCASEAVGRTRQATKAVLQPITRWPVMMHSWTERKETCQAEKARSLCAIVIHNRTNFEFARILLAIKRLDPF